MQLDVLFCGVCHSDLHQVRDEWRGVMPAVDPCVPGHEVVGRIVKAGSGVTVGGYSDSLVVDEAFALRASLRRSCSARRACRRGSSTRRRSW